MSLLSTALLAAISLLPGRPPEPRALHSVALVNDPLSHGAVGDSLLSLNEAIGLNQGTLQGSQLSSAELRQVVGTTNDVRTILVDTAVTPKITLERTLFPITTVPHGTSIEGSNGQPEIELGANPGFFLGSSYADLRSLKITGGSGPAVTITQGNALFGTAVSNVTFEGQSGTAVRINLVGSGNTDLRIERSTFNGSGTAIEINDSPLRRVGNITIDDITITGGMAGLRVQLGSGGGTLAITLTRISMVGTDLGVSFERPTGSADREVVLDATYVVIGGATTALSFQGLAGARDRLRLRMLDLAAASDALRVSPAGADHQVTVEDSRLDGDVILLAGGDALPAAGPTDLPGTLPISLDTCEITGGRLALGVTSGGALIEHCIVLRMTVTAAGGAPVRVATSRVEQTTLTGTPSAPIHVSGSYLAGVTAGPHVTVGNSVSAPQLGTLDVTPQTVQLGASLYLQPQLPAGLTGTWVIGLAERSARVLGPFRLYFFSSANVVLTPSVRLTTTTVLPVPNDPVLIGQDFAVQLLVVPDPGVQAPVLAMPPGRRIVVR